jgi:hypothetical protein
MRRRLEIHRMCKVPMCNKCVFGAPPSLSCAFRLEILMIEDDMREAQRCES